MPSRQEKARRQRLVKALARPQPPFPLEALVALFRHLDKLWNESDGACDNKLTQTRLHLAAAGFAPDEVASTLEWLVSEGGGCDCEVLANVADRWVPDYDATEWWFDAREC